MGSATCRAAPTLPFISLRWRRLATWEQPTLQVHHMELVTVMDNAPATLSGSTARLTAKAGSQTRLTLTTTVVKATWVHAAQRWTCGRQTRSQLHSHRTLPPLRVFMYAWVMRSAVGRMVIASLHLLTAMDATSMHTAWAFYGEGSQFQVNTQRPFKVVTRFHAPAGELTAIEQFYIQDGKEIHHPN